MSMNLVADLIAAEGINARPKHISPARWAAMVARLRNENYLPHRTIKVELYGGGHRWYCKTCDIRREYLTIISWTNSTPPKSCPTCGGVQ